MNVPAKILVVDDTEMNRDMLSTLVEADGHKALLAENGRIGLEMLKAEPFDLVLLDVMMPEMNGYQVLEQLKADANLRAIPVIVLSALDEIGSVVRCIELGAEDYLPKPFDPVLLRARIGACLEKKRLRDQEVQLRGELAEWNQTLEQRVQEQVDQLERLKPTEALLFAPAGRTDRQRRRRRSAENPPAGNHRGLFGSPRLHRVR